MGCPDISTNLDCDEAWLILEPFFSEMQDVFVDAGLDLCRRTRLYCAPWVHDTPRHFAACRTDGRAIVVAPEMAELPYPTVIAMFAHEFGHAADYLYPGEFQVDDDRELVRLDRDDFDDVTWANWMRAWEGRDADAIEFSADAIAEYATGAPVGYLGPCQLQCFHLGRARPEGLR